MPDTTYIVRLYPYDSFTEEYEQYDRATAEDFFRTFSPYVPEQYRTIELTSYNYATLSSIRTQKPRIPYTTTARASRTICTMCRTSTSWTTMAYT